MVFDRLYLNLSLRYLLPALSNLRYAKRGTINRRKELHSKGIKLYTEKWPKITKRL